MTDKTITDRQTEIVRKKEKKEKKKKHYAKRS